MPDNGKVERSHRSDQEEFYQLLDYTDDVELKRKLADWEKVLQLRKAARRLQWQDPLTKPSAKSYCQNCPAASSDSQSQYHF
jgi:hypothetical protein